MNSGKWEETVSGQTVSLRDRKRLDICGVSDVVNFDEQSIELSTECGALYIEGENLHVKTLNLEKGTVTVEGKVNALSYEDSVNRESNGKTGFFGRLFH